MEFKECQNEGLNENEKQPIHEKVDRIEREDDVLRPDDSQYSYGSGPHFTNDGDPMKPMHVTSEKYGCAVIIFIVLLMGVCALTACSTHRVTTKETVRVEEVHDTITRTREVKVLAPADSARLRAFLECDSNGRVLLRAFDQMNTTNARLKFSLDSLGHLKVNFLRPTDTIRVAVHDTLYKDRYISNSQKEKVIEKKLTWRQRWLIFAGGICEVLLIAVALVLVSYFMYTRDWPAWIRKIFK